MSKSNTPSTPVFNAVRERESPLLDEIVHNLFSLASASDEQLPKLGVSLSELLHKLDKRVVEICKEMGANASTNSEVYMAICTSVVSEAEVRYAKVLMKEASSKGDQALN